MDLNIEITKLYALHNATMLFEHAIRERGNSGSLWKEFAPSRFIYAFFTFNTIYSIDWMKSFSSGKAIYWEKDKEGKYPRETEQMKSYLYFIQEHLGNAAANHFQIKVVEMCNLYDIQVPARELEEINITNESKDVKKLRKQIPEIFSKIYKNELKPNDFYSTTSLLMKFIYFIRCNLFHGRKTNIELLDEGQQKRLLIYTAILISVNSLLFECASTVHWHKVPVSLST